MHIPFYLRLNILAVIVALLSGCATDQGVRGRLKYDTRQVGPRDMTLIPHPPDIPRYRYLGELVGESNFEDISDKSLNSTINILKWLAGVSERKTPILMQRPHHGTVGDNGRVYVVDAGRNAVIVFDQKAPLAPDEEVSERGEGQMLIWEFADARNRFQGPVAIATVWNGDIAVSDAILGVVARLNKKGEPVGMLGADNLQRPTGLAFDPVRGLLFVADRLDNSIKVFDATGKIVNTFGSAGDGPGELNAPTHLAFSGGRLYVSDTLNSRVQIFDGDGRWIRQFGQRGVFVGNMTRPKGVAVGEGGIIYVVESFFAHLLAYNEQDEFMLGISSSGLKGGEFLLPSGVWADKSGRVFVADMFNARVVVFQYLGGDGE